MFANMQSTMAGLKGTEEEGGKEEKGNKEEEKEAEGKKEELWYSRREEKPLWPVLIRKIHVNLIFISCELSIENSSDLCRLSNLILLDVIYFFYSSWGEIASIFQKNFITLSR